LSDDLFIVSEFSQTAAIRTVRLAQGGMACQRKWSAQVLKVLLNNCEIIGNRFFFARIGANAKNPPGFFSSVADKNPVDFKFLVARFTADKQCYIASPYLVGFEVGRSFH